MNDAIVEMLVERTADVYALRQSGRLAAAALGCDEADQVRLATALSEIGREVVAHKGSARARFFVDGDGPLAISIAPFPKAALRDASTSAAIDAARRLIGTIDVVNTGDESAIVVRTSSLARGRHVVAEDLQNALATESVRRPLDDLRLQNRDLIVTLNDLKAKQDELLRLNVELEETNRGVVAMYTRLAEELEETNRGVVALYAELDEKTVQLKSASDAKSRFLANVSHELRSPVHSILGLTRILFDRENQSLTGEQQRQVELIQGAADDLLGLVNGLLDISKAESGKLDADVTPVAIDRLFQELRGSLRPLVQPGVELRVIEPPAGTTFETDRVLLAQVLRNLLTNALKFTTQGSVTLEYAQPNGYTGVFTVADTGIGIAPDDIARVFEEFFQVRGPLQRLSKGTGLGLPYARRVAEFLGGELDVTSALGSGSTFTVTLPQAWQALRYGRADAGIEGLRLRKALIIDDDGALRTVLRGMLQGVADQVYEAAGGYEGLEKMTDLRPDAVILDLGLPDLHGADVVAEARKRPELRDTPIVIVSSASPLPKALSGMAFLSKSSLNRQALGESIAQARAGVRA